MSPRFNVALVYGTALCGVASLALLACTHMQAAPPTRSTAATEEVADNGTGRPAQTDFSIYKGMAATVKGQPLYLVPTDYVSPLGRTFDDGHPIVLQPGDAFVLVDQVGDLLHLQFNYPEVSIATVPVSNFPTGSLQFNERSIDVNDEATAGPDMTPEYAPTDIASGHGTRAGKNYHKGGTDCAHNPHHPGCCLAAVKFELIALQLVRGIFPVTPREFGLYATKCLPSNFKSVGCEGRKSPIRGTVCSYVSSLSPGEGHVEVWDGIGWYFGLGHETLQNDGHHQCEDCKNPVGSDANATFPCK